MSKFKVSTIKHQSIIYICPYCGMKTSNYVVEFASSDILPESKLISDPNTSLIIFYMLTCMTCNNSYIVYEKVMQKYLLKNKNISSIYKGLDSQWGVAEQKIVYPQQVNSMQVPAPSKYMPEDVQSMYNEAASVFDISPRSSAALIRLALELLLKKYLVNDGKKHPLSEMIGMLSPHAPSLVTEFMDLIREKGNGEVHPELDKIELEKLRHKWGDITREPDKDEILYLFKYINFICELLGLRDKADKDFESIPKDKRNNIARRNQKFQNKPNSPK